MDIVTKELVPLRTRLGTSFKGAECSKYLHELYKTL